VAATEPQVQPKTATGYTVRQGGANVAGQGKALFDYSTYAALYQPCIAAPAAAPGRCTALVAKGLLTGADLTAQQADAKARLKAYGWLAGFRRAAGCACGHQYPGRRHVCQCLRQVLGHGQGLRLLVRADRRDRVPVAFTAAQKASSFATQNGIIGSVVYEDSVGGAKAYNFGVSPSTGLADQSLDGFLCLRALATGVDPVTGGALGTPPWRRKVRG
jgi:hydroxybutyrate-dimer hydrolase